VQRKNAMLMRLGGIRKIHSAAKGCSNQKGFRKRNTGDLPCWNSGQSHVGATVNFGFTNPAPSGDFQSLL